MVDAVGVMMNSTDISTGQRGPMKFPVNSRIDLTITISSVHCELIPLVLLSLKLGSHSIIIDQLVGNSAALSGELWW